MCGFIGTALLAMIEDTYSFVEVECEVVFLEGRVDHTSVVIVQQEVLGIVLASLKQQHNVIQ